LEATSFAEKSAKSFITSASFATVNHEIIRSRATDHRDDDDPSIADDHDVASFNTDIGKGCISEFTASVPSHGQTLVIQLPVPMPNGAISVLCELVILLCH
jgi:hypothetical protein